MRLRFLHLFALLTSLASLPASATSFFMDKVADVVAPSTRGSAQTTYFGWETFDAAGTPAVIDDSTPDIGTTSTGVNFHTTSGVSHRSSTGNFYSFSTAPSELVTVVTDGSQDSTGFTTIIAQLLTSGGPLGGAVLMGQINGVTPTVVQGTNLAGKGQVWAFWKVPGNQAAYTFTIGGAANTTDYSFDRVIVDTSYSPAAVADDTMTAVTPSLVASLNRATGLLTPSTRGGAKSTWFGWDNFTDANNLRVDPIDDSTPDIGTTTTGVRFKTNNGGLHYSPNPASFNFYSEDGPADETVTVVTNGIVGATGTTTIIAQAVTASMDFPEGPLTFSAINGHAPTVARRANKNGNGQIWARWELPGNQATYTFTVVGRPNTSFTQFVVDTVWKASGSQPDSVTVYPAPLASVMDRVSGLVVPSSRGDDKTTWFGWETFADVNGTFTGVVNDSTPDIGTTAVGANFQTTNGQVHHIGGGSNIYTPPVSNPAPAPILAEQITVPTNGTVGAEGVTTIVLQIESASGGPSTSEFAGHIGLTIDGVAPTLDVQSLNTSGKGDLWAKWVIPGNKASYTIILTGDLDQPHYSFDRVIVDTLFSESALADTMVASNLAISNATLPVGKTGAVYAPVTFAATEGTTPYTWTVSAGTLPAGLALSATGELSGTPTTAGTASFTVTVTDKFGNTASKAFSLKVATPVVISSAATPASTLINSAYNVSLTAIGGSEPYAWAVLDGALPPGLDLSTAGIISGNSSAGGSFSFTAQVTDDNGFTATKALQITVAVLEISTPSLVPGVKGQVYSQTLTATGGTGNLTWTRENGTLPAGLTLSASGVLSGKPTTPVLNTPLTFKVTDSASFSVTKAFTLTVTAGYLLPVLTPPVLGTVTVGTLFTCQLSATNYPKTFTVTGLPPGITYAPATGLISGRPTVAGAFSVKVKATNTAGATATVTVPMVVKALPNTLIGSFIGLVARDVANNNLGSLLSLTTTPTGAFTAKVTTGTTLKTYTGFLAATAPQIDTVATAALPKLTLALDASTNLISGTSNGAALSGWRQTWNASTNPPVTRQGYYSMGIEQTVDDGLATTPHGSGYATFTVAPAGTLTVTGKTADNLVISTAGFVGPNGQIAVYTPLYASLGSVTGKLILADDPDGSFSENVVSGPLTWVKPAVPASHTYPAAFSLNLSAYGKYLAHTTVGAVEVLGLPDTGTANLVFEDGGLDQSVTDPDVTGFTYTDANTVIMPTFASGHNPGKVVLTIAKATGLVGGNFTLVDTAPALTRKVTFQGQIVRPASGNARAVGYFLLTQKPGIATSAVLSGKVSIQQPQ